jgi:HlyD family secretion protein
MKRRTFIVLLLILVGAVLAGGWWWARSAPEQATQFLVDGGLGSDQAEEVIALAGGHSGAEEEDVLIASGSIEGEEVSIVSEIGGRIVRLDVDEGESVGAGQALVELDASQLLAQMAQARAAVAAAEADLENLKAGTHPAELLAAEATLRKATAEKEAARTTWKGLQAIADEPQDMDAQIAQAESGVELSKAQVEQAEAQLALAEAERHQYRAQGSMEEKLLYRVYDYQVQAAQASLEASRAGQEAAEETLAALKQIRSEPLALISEARLAQALFKVAKSGEAVARAKLVDLEAGPPDEEVAVLEAYRARTEASLAALQAQVEKMTLRTPIAGVVSSRSAHKGEAAVAGAILLTISNLDEVELTVYIPEDELGRVYLGQLVEVQVDSFPGMPFTGTVSYVSSQAEFTPKNVQTEKERVNMVFAVKVRLPNPDHLLKPGMPADAFFGD